MQAPSFRPRRGAVGGSAAILVIGLLALPRPAAAATITVDNPVIGDGTDGLCDLVEAIDNANDDAATHPDCKVGEPDPVVDVIELTVDVTLDETFIGTAQTRGPVGLPQVVSAMEIRSDASAVPRTIQRDPQATDHFRLLFVGLEGDLVLQDVVLSGGSIRNVRPPQAFGGFGGAIFNEDTLSLRNSTVSGSSVRADAQGGAGVYPYAYGGGIFNLGALTLTDSTVADNSVYAKDNGGLALSAGGGISNGSLFAAVQGGGPQLTLIGSTVSANVSDARSGSLVLVYGGGIYGSDGDMSGINSTISGNVVQGYGAAGSYAEGGGVEVIDATLVLTHSTVAANVKEGTPGDTFGAGIDVLGIGSATLDGSVLGHQVGDNCANVTDGGLSLADDDTCGTIPGTLIGLDPVLADNGGPTETHAIGGGSNARDHAGSCGLPTDQRGMPRSDGDCDSGSYEFFCNAPDGEDQELDFDDLADELTVEVCGTITGGPDYRILDGGHLIARAGREVVLVGGFEVRLGGRLTIEIDPTIQAPILSQAPILP